MRRLLYKFSQLRDPYKILQISPTATQAQIKNKYHQLAKMYHPDFNKATEQKFKTINQAYEILGNQDKRKEFDSTGFSSNKPSRSADSSTSYSYKSGFHYGHNQQREYRANNRRRTFYEYNPYAEPKEQSDFTRAYQYKSQDYDPKAFRDQLNREYQRTRSRAGFILFMFMTSILGLQLMARLSIRQDQRYQVVDRNRGVTYYTDRRTYEQLMRDRRNLDLFLKDMHQMELQESRH